MKEPLTHVTLRLPLSELVRLDNYLVERGKNPRRGRSDLLRTIIKNGLDKLYANRGKNNG